MLEDLTPRERELFDLLLERVSPKEIAHKLNISDHTVAFHRTKLYNKLDVQNIKELFAKYSTNGKAPPPEDSESSEIVPSATAPVSPVKKRLKILLPVGIALVAFSVVFMIILLMSPNRKPTADTKLKGVIIPVNNLGFSTTSDVKIGGSSTAEVFITQEKIDGTIIDSVLNLKTNLARNGDSTMVYAMAYTRKNDIIQRLRQANGIRFKALGDGKVWDVEFQTVESTPERENACYTYMLGTAHDQVVVVDIPYSSLFLPDWWEQYQFDFNKENIKSLAITATYGQGYGSSFLQIFDFEIY
jgi:DNA-binding CsgD family transcriptional regulator